jgi:hypothetical protein
MRGVVLVVLATFTLLVDCTFISIRGHAKAQRLPMASIKSWTTHTYDLYPPFGESELEHVPDPVVAEGEGWTDPTSFDELYVPADLPMPMMLPALGVCVAQGVPRYVMPSCVLYLETPEGKWRNRGLSTLPRATAWIDTFSEFGANSIRLLELSAFVQDAPNLKFLEDQDGASNWQCLLSQMATGSSSEGVTASIPVAPVYDEFCRRLREDPVLYQQLSEGYHFVDIPIPTDSSRSRSGNGSGSGSKRGVPLKLSSLNYRTGGVDVIPSPTSGTTSGTSGQRYLSSVPMQLPPAACKVYLSDFEDPKRLLQFDNLAQGRLDPATGTTAGAGAMGGGDNYTPPGGNNNPQTPPECMGGGKFQLEGSSGSGNGDDRVRRRGSSSSSSSSSSRGGVSIAPSSMLDGEPCGELAIVPVRVAAGGASEFLPEVYRSLFEAGNVLYTG